MYYANIEALQSDDKKFSDAVVLRQTEVSDNSKLFVDIPQEIIFAVKQQTVFAIATSRQDYVSWV